MNKSSRNTISKNPWWDLINELASRVTVPMVEEKYSVQTEGENESIFDLVIRSGLAPNFQGAVSLLANEFPPPPPPPRSLWQKIMDAIPAFGGTDF